MEKTKKADTPRSITLLCANTPTPSAITEDQLDWVEQLQANHLLIGPTRSGKTRLSVEFVARRIQCGGAKE